MQAQYTHCSHTANWRDHCSRYNSLRAASQYPCFHPECTSLETASRDKLNAHQRAEALLYPEYRAKATPDPAGADLQLCADPPLCCDCLVHDKINTCGVLHILQSDPHDADCGSQKKHRGAPEFIEDVDLRAVARVMKKSCHNPHALIASVNVPPACSTVYEDVASYSADDPNL